MPYLPSGRAVALDLSPLANLAERAEKEHNPWLLGSLENIGCVLSLIRVVEVEERPDIPDAELLEAHGPDEVRYCVAHDTGISVLDIANGRSHWSYDDVEAFNQFMLTDRIHTAIFLRWLNLVGLRKKLTEETLA